MNDDDDDLIDAVRERLFTVAAELTPEGYVERARRAVHRRVARAAAVIGVPVALVAATTAFLISSNNTRPHSVDAAYIARQVSARLDQEALSYRVVHSVYTDPDGTRTSAWSYARGLYRYQSISRTSDHSGHVEQIVRGVGSIRHVPGKGPRIATQMQYVFPQSRTWWQQHSLRKPFFRKEIPTVGASGAALARFIRQGYFVRDGIRDIHGQRALRLRLRYSHLHLHETGVLYVNASSYEPIESIESDHEEHSSFVVKMDWLAATPANRAKAVHPIVVPPGYKRLLPPSQRPHARHH